MPTARKSSKASTAPASTSASPSGLTSGVAPGPAPGPVRSSGPSPGERAASAVFSELVIESPIGPLLLLADDEALFDVYFPNNMNGALLRSTEAAARAKPSPKAERILRETAKQLGEYFAGTRRDFDLPMRTGGTEFQQQVWRALCTIPFGATWSYGQLATSVGNPNASRAVGAANGKNPIPVIIPCHRVIGANGSLTGFGGGEPTKRWLLDHEAKVAGLRLL